MSVGFPDQSGGPAMGVTDELLLAVNQFAIPE